MLDGAMTAMTTPMHDDGAIDFHEFKRQIEFQIKNGIKGVVVLGTTGEAENIEHDEREQLIRIAVENFKKPGERFVFVGTGSAKYKEMIYNTEQAKDLGADAAMVVTPPYVKPNKKGLISYFEEAQKIMKTLVYDISGRTGRQITDEEFKSILQFENVIGVKAASGDLNQITNLINNIALPIQKTGRDMRVFSGDDKLTVPVRHAGGSGVISVASNAIPDRIQKLAKLTDGVSESWKEARALEPFINALFNFEGNPASIKYIMWLNKQIESYYARPPYGDLQDANKQKIREIVTPYFQNIRA